MVLRLLTIKLFPRYKSYRTGPILSSSTNGQSKRTEILLSNTVAIISKGGKSGGLLHEIPINIEMIKARFIKDIHLKCIDLDKNSFEIR